MLVFPAKYHLFKKKILEYMFGKLYLKNHPLQKKDMIPLF
ncbi:hypothetical protein B1P88_01260 [Enterococcus faecium]|uniref:Uncharacterized protein n=3 Tax=Enterococcus faecium TaxID=1352 RepID=I3TYM8_ENTFD|nr:hypothetical protein HMPREF0351_10242 [Enterococcus faecium DO]EFR69684.1 hypothetical protein HMPREF9524_00095 [Enterococcus faecium TX0133a01]EFR72861.1 hypothetical protein HMPREF9526_00041 [Enterococcus faecium TX0133B]EFR74027.1 hypothetical protein HMPREF9523_02046 [Enterococcus faecium TX0133A]EFR76670.1 hypothetical protein HMPREF9527_02505 [Enterococcus faecium TX0133C]EFS06284.1 hypothetical protein HMPREF9525_01621 [Enterococcus faecium TX0133a04]EFS08916.1 hypothetical protein 